MVLKGKLITILENYLQKPKTKVLVLLGKHTDNSSIDIYINDLSHDIPSIYKIFALTFFKSKELERIFLRS